MFSNELKYLVLAGPAVLILQNLFSCYVASVVLFEGTGREILNSNPTEKLFIHLFIVGVFPVRIQCRSF